MKILFKIFKGAWVILASLFSMILLLLFFLLVVVTWRLVGPAELRDIYHHDRSLIPVIQTQLAPFYFSLAIGYAIWGFFLFASKMRKLMWSFFSLSCLSLVLSVAALPVLDAILTKPVTKNEEMKRHQKIIESTNIAKEKLVHADKLPLNELEIALFEVSRLPRTKDLIPVWALFAKRVINEWPQEDSLLKKEIALNRSVDALQKYYGNRDALQELQSIEKELRQSGMPKNLKMFYDVMYAEEHLLNPPYRIVDGDFPKNEEYFIQNFNELQVRLRKIQEGRENMLRGDSLIQKGLYSQALEMYHAGLKSEYVISDEDQTELRRRIVRVLLLMGRYGEALSEWRWFKTRYHDPQRYEFKLQQINALIDYEKTKTPEKVFAYVEALKAKGKSYGFFSSNSIDPITAEIIFLYDAVGANDVAIKLIDDWVTSFYDEQEKKGKKIKRVYSIMELFPPNVREESHKRVVEVNMRVSKNEVGLAMYLTVKAMFQKNAYDGSHGAATLLLLQKEPYTLL